MAKGVWLQDKINNYVLRGTAPGLPATGYVFLATTAVVAADDGSTVDEITYTDYARVAVTLDGSTFAASSTGLSASSAAFTFPAPTGDGNAAAVSAGMLSGNAGTSADKLMYFDADIGSLTILNGDTAPTIASGSFTHQEG